eukprot:TRINITY_DN2241_c0_g1_i1.p1 TRINITY_DN2241_c0_g1~~TRINITY_DN2241_c0_g1_i1.p1  ORF type:complete len:315 (-),score=115.87 TRINITY_DN2241_c0_g1_i1:243-1187(-)
MIDFSCLFRERMPKSVTPDVWISENGGESVWKLSISTASLVCIPCSKSYAWNSRALAQRHAKTKLHIKTVEVTQQSQKTHESGSGKPDLFAKDLAKMLALCKIPMGKVENKHFSRFLEKYTGIVTPSRSAIVRNVELEGVNILNKIRDILEGQDVYIFMDEATDMTGKPVVGIYLGLLGKFLSRPFLIDLSETKSHDSESLVIAVSKSLQDLWNGSIRAERIKFIVTQPMPHANEAARSLQSLFPGLEHFYCTSSRVEALGQRVGEESDKVSRLFMETKRVLKFHLSDPKFGYKMSKIHLKSLLLIQWNVDLMS